MFFSMACASLTFLMLSHTLFWSIYLSIHYWAETRRMDTALGNVQDLQRSRVYRDDFIVISPNWTSQTCYSHLQSECFYPFSLGFLVSICMQCSGGLLYQREEYNILLVCLALWHLNKLERCINLAKDQGQSDGWTGIISHFSCSVFIAINFKQGNRLQGVCCIRKEACTLLWLIGILV